MLVSLCAFRFRKDMLPHCLHVEIEMQSPDVELGVNPSLDGFCSTGGVRWVAFVLDVWG